MLLYCDLMLLVLVKPDLDVLITDKAQVDLVTKGDGC